MEIIFDGDCGICQASVSWLQRHDVHHTLTMVPSFELGEQDSADLPLDRTVILRTSNHHYETKARAVTLSLSVLPGVWGYLGRSGSLLLKVPLVRFVGDGLYDLVAANRGSISAFLVRRGLLDAACKVPEDRA